MERLVKAGLLYDFYGGLLTAKQRKAIELYYQEDWSLAEIAAEEDVSRQAIHDLLGRSERQMEEYEAKLGLVERFLKRQSLLTGALAKVDCLLKITAGSPTEREELLAVKKELQQLLESDI